MTQGNYGIWLFFPSPWCLLGKSNARLGPSKESWKRNLGQTGQGTTSQLIKDSFNPALVNTPGIKWTKHVLLRNMRKISDFFWCFFQKWPKTLEFKKNVSLPKAKYAKQLICTSLQNKHTFPKLQTTSEFTAENQGLNGWMGLENESSIEIHWFQDVTPTHNETYLSTTFS